MSKKLFVGNLNFRTTQDELVEIFSDAGQLVDVHLPVDRISGQPRGFAFVEYSTEAEAQAAVERFNGFEVGGRELRVNVAEERAPRGGGGGGGAPRQFRNSNAPGGGGGGGGYRKPNKPKGSRRGLRGRKRSL